METSQKSALRAEDASQPQSAPTQTYRPLTQKDVADAFEGVRQRANAGNARAREFVKKFFDARPELVTRFGNTARHTRAGPH